MSIYVVDASVAVKWFFDEPLSDESTRLLDASYVLHAPDLFLIEIDSVLCKKIRRGEISEGEAQEIRSAVDIFPLQKHPFRLLLDSAFELAVQTQSSPYDCLYLILAISLGAQMVTADRRFYDSISRSQLAIGSLCWVEDLPKSSSET
ncbi:MAG: type II toxin-antitoxin system VapC family toxin [Syntrophobacteraceae bacterium]